MHNVCMLALVPGSGVCTAERYLQRSKERPAEEPRGAGPFFFIAGTNGAAIVSSYCERRGWRRIYDKQRDDFKLKWCETKSSANYCNFREGKQLMYQIPNDAVLTTKIGLLGSLREYEGVSDKISRGRGPSTSTACSDRTNPSSPRDSRQCVALRRTLKMEEFIPATFRMDLRTEREAFFATVSNTETQMWICKPSGLNQGRGIFLLKSQEDIRAFRLKLQNMEDSQAGRRALQRQPQPYIVQQYIQNPLLLKGKKFDVRSYLLIACTSPFMVFFRHGYVRLTCNLYDSSSNDPSTHLTNQYVQKKNPLYSQLKEDTVWSMESFNTYVNNKFRVAKGLPWDWVLGTFTKRMQQILTQCFFAVKSKLDRRLGFFDLIGCDFMVDTDFKVWLLEMNCNPALHTNCEVLKEVIPSTLVETLDLTLEIFNKCRLRQRILPLANQREFALLYNELYPPDLVPASRRSNAFNAKRNIKNKNTKLRRSKSGSSKRTPLESPEEAGEGRPRPTTSVLNKKGRTEIGASRRTSHSGSKVKGDAAE
uniref:Tubulin tyrosine ligase like 10 n=1 Tax=Takifugu rubripes TaxID=31033 RepID=A0A3B5K0N4_TAKRU